MKNPLVALGWLGLLVVVGLLLPPENARADAPELTISGLVQHRNEDGDVVPSRYIKVQARESQFLPDYTIAEGYTDDTGHFTFTHDTGGNRIRNEDTGIGESGTRDIYFKTFAENEGARVSPGWVTGVLGFTYWGETGTDYDVSAPVYDHTMTMTDENAPAYGIPSLIRADREWLALQAGGWMRDQLGVLYPDTDWPNFFSIWLYNVMRIPAGWADNSTTISHEYGHGVHYSARGSGLPDPNPVPTGEEDPRDGTPQAGQGAHWIFSESSGGFALTEGWAEFFAAARHGDASGLEENDYWMGADGNGPSGPNTDGTTGEIVEGAFASILWDLYDGANDDSIAGIFSSLWAVFLNDDPDRVWSPAASDDFYHYWTSRFGQTRAVDEIFIDHGIPVRDDPYDSGGGNDASSSASDLGTITDTRTESDLILTDLDWYEFTTVAKGGPSDGVAILFDNSRGDLDLYVYRSDGTTLVGSSDTSYGDSEMVSLYLEPAGTYKFKVVGHGDDASTSGVYEGDFSPNYELRIPPAQLDLAFVIDTTGSMWDDIAAVKSASTAIVNAVMDGVPGSRIAVVTYRDFPTGPYGGAGDFPFRDNLDFSSDREAILNAIQALSTGGGADWRESVYCALIHTIESHPCDGRGIGDGLEWRSIPSKFIILMGDAPPHDPEPFTGFALSDVVTAAENADPVTIEVVSVGGTVEYFDQLAEQTGGSVFPAGGAGDVVDAILEAIETILNSPVADAGGPYEATVGSPIAFDASGSYDPDGTIVSYEWDWDSDGAYDEATASPTVEHTYSAPYSGQVRLRVTDNDGLTGIAMAGVTVTGPAAVGGIADLPDAAGLPLETPSSSGPDVGVLAGGIAGAAVVVMGLGGAAWYARRRWLT